MDGERRPADATLLERPEEFQDYQGEVLEGLGRFRWSALSSPESFRAIVAMIVGIVLLAWDGPSPRVTALLIGIGLVVLAITDPLQRRARKDRVWVPWTLVMLAAGIAFIVWPGITADAVGRLVGAVILARGLAILYEALNKPTTDRAWQITKALLTLALGGAVVLVPETMFEMAVTLVIFALLLGGVITVTNNLRSEKTIELRGAWDKFTEWLEGRPHTADDRSQLYDKLFYEGELGERRLSRFFILMGFATAIATFGVVADSTAVVIGAMLIAPLMTPLMATSCSLIMGWPKRAGLSALVALLGIALAIGLAILIGAGLPFEVLVTNSQVASRINPTMVDLAIAIAAGGAGAFALSRPDVSDALPGVAVAIALVPPLAVIGLMIEAGEGDAAIGATLLFITNLVAILLTGAIVFVLTGVVPVSQLVQNARWIRSSVGLVAALAIIVVAALAVSGERITADAFSRTEAQEAVDAWLGPETMLTVFDVTVGPSDVSVVVVGPSAPPEVDDLAAALETALGEPVDVTVSWVPQTEFLFEAEN